MGIITKDVFENKKSKLELKKDSFGNIAVGKETIHNMSDDIQWDEDNILFNGTPQVMTML